MSAPTPPQSSSSSDIDDNVSTAPSSLSPSSSAPSSIGPSSPKVSHDALKPESLGYELPVSQRSKEEYEVYEVPAYHESYPPLPEKKILDGPSTVGVPDDWVLRDSRMVHLTGKHPYNVEAPLPDLFSSGFLTPNELFYVRTHGTTPRVDQDLANSWKVEVGGMVKNPLSLSLADLKSKFETVTLPVTLVCAGNRRKEQNIVRKGLGFNWGAAGVSTALFTGVYLSDILALAEPTTAPNPTPTTTQPLLFPRHVVFEGADDLPQGRYGTSQTIARSKDKSKGMLIAWLMNGLPLEPDHGFPIRLVVPGQIGGRSVKWLNKIEVSHQESQHYLHFWDNKLLPTEVMPEQARAEKKWWYDPKYIINDLNVNSAIAQPDHNEVLDLKTANETYTMKGYAYAGGGRRITRVEVSLDDGQTWKLAEITYPEDLYRQIAYSSPVYGNIDLTQRDECFCWCFWSFDVSIESIKECPALIVRAMDESLALQPRDMYWNAMSMMNNWWFRVVVHHNPSDSTLKFEHPTLAGTAAGGWMERLKAEGQDVLRPSFGQQQQTTVGEGNKEEKRVEEVKMTKEGVDRKITQEELDAHNSASEPWFVVNGEVYDGTAFLKDHPGGGESITLMAGQDASEDFMAIHSPQGKSQLVPFHIGTLIASSSTASASESSEKTIDPIFLSKKSWKKVELVSIDQVSHDSSVYRFKLEKEDQALGLPIGHHVFVRLRRKDGEMVQRAYTPISLPSTTGFIDLLIKVYRPSTAFPLGGKMSVGFDQLQVGQSIEIKGPLGSFEWIGDGHADWRGVKRKIRHVGMVCGGSGITPILQILRGVFADSADTETHVYILDSNRTLEDILCKQDLDSYLAEERGYAPRYHLHHTLTAPPLDWPSNYSKGRITLDMMRKHLPNPSEDSVILLCGPDGLIEKTVKPGLKELGFDLETAVHCF